MGDGCAASWPQAQEQRTGRDKRAGAFPRRSGKRRAGSGVQGVNTRALIHCAVSLDFVPASPSVARVLVRLASQSSLAAHFK